MRSRHVIISTAVAVTVAIAAWLLWPKPLLKQFYDWDLNTYNHIDMHAYRAEEVRKGEGNGKVLYTIEYKSEIADGTGPAGGSMLCARFMQFMTAQDGGDTERDKFHVKVVKKDVLLARDTPGQDTCDRVNP